MSENVSSRIDVVGTEPGKDSIQSLGGDELHVLSPSDDAATAMKTIQQPVCMQEIAGSLHMPRD
jgi:hypothetical protein